MLVRAVLVGCEWQSRDLTEASLVTSRPARMLSQQLMLWLTRSRVTTPVCRAQYRPV